MEDSFMKINIQSVKFDADKKLLDFVRQKVGKLLQFHDDILGSEVILRLENVQGDDNKVTEVILNIPGNNLFAKKQSKTFEEAVDGCVDALRKQLKKQKDKLRK
jgi:putative sigma-54 modulation protein